MTNNPINSINFNLETVWIEAKKRNYNFDERKFDIRDDIEQINVTSGQIGFEKDHLLKKLKLRDINMYNKFVKLNEIEIHPLFKLIEG